MTNEIRRLYLQARKAGYHAAHALSAAKTVSRFKELESLDLVKIELEPEQESYFDVYGDEDGYTDGFGRRVSAEERRKEIEEMIERDGCWCSCGYFKVDDDWELADSCGMHVGYNDASDWRENWYIPDIMAETIRHLESSWSDNFDGAYA